MTYPDDFFMNIPAFKKKLFSTRFIKMWTFNVIWLIAQGIKAAFARFILVVVIILDINQDFSGCTHK
jgi:hypothetical protein